MVIKCDKGYFIASNILIVIFLICFCNAFFTFLNDNMPMEFVSFAILLGVFGFNLTVGYSIAVCKTLTFTREGIEVSIWLYKKFYKWENLKFRKLESYKNYLIVNSETHQPPYLRCVKFYKKSIKNSKYKNPNSFFSMFHPISFIYVNFLDESITDEDLKKYRETRFTYNEKDFMTKMKEWNVEIVDDL